MRRVRCASPLPNRALDKSRLHDDRAIRNLVIGGLQAPDDRPVATVFADAVGDLVERAQHAASCRRPASA